MSVGQKLNFGANMNRLTEKRAETALRKTGEVLLASVIKQNGSIVAAAFEPRDIPYVFPQVTIPLFGPQYIRHPMQPDDKGIVIPADTYLGEVSGWGGGAADLTPPMDLSVLVFLPISSTEWEDVGGQVVTIYGPEGAIVRDAGSNTMFLLIPDSIIIATPTQFKVTVGPAAFILMDDMWNLTGQAGKLRDGIANINPAIMYEGWKSLVSWCNSHAHSNGNGGNNTRNAIAQFNGNITE